MSTRSGKKIHSSFFENTLKPDVEHIPQSERKTRSSRFKENVELSVSVLKTKKRANYVSYPTDDEVGSDVVDVKVECKTTRSLRNNALKEHNNEPPSTESADPPTARTTRRTRKFAEDVVNTHDNHNHDEAVINAGIKPKKEKKKKKSISNEVAEPIISKKKSKKKVKKAKRSGSMIVEDLTSVNIEKETLKRGNMSVESFHSAAGSPFKHTVGHITVNIISPPKDFKAAPTSSSPGNMALKIEGRQTRSVARLSHVHIAQSTPDIMEKESRKRKSSFIECDKTTTGNETFDVNTEVEHDITLTNTAKKRKSNIKNTISGANTDITSDGENKDSMFDLENLERRKSAIKAIINTTYDKSESPKSVTDTTFNKSGHLDAKDIIYEKVQLAKSNTQTPPHKLNSTYEKSEHKTSTELVTDYVKERPAINTTFEKDDLENGTVTQISTIINTTYEKESDTDTKQDTKVRQSSIIHDTYNKHDVSSDILSETENSNSNLKFLQQESKSSTDMNSTYDKTEKSDSKEKKLDTTFDKNSKSSLISSDNSNITLDKSDVSRISITSDDSKDNIINTTPVLIESSLDDSQINSSKLDYNNDIQLNKSKAKSPSETTKVSPIAPVTPLKREGTFTKEGSDIITECQFNSLKTPMRKLSLPSPGCTPFPSKCNSKDKSIMNGTRSLEKSRRSSLVEPLPRATRVMFCSPENNPVVVAQQRRKVIKSNLKGSNKSFVFEDEPVSRAAPRKRSYTQSDAEDTQAKRNRHANTSLGRLSRTRTTSATAKLVDPGTPSKKSIITPKKETKVSRTKLPDFAALHRREFAKMESLDECQERKARRARHLLTPTGAVTVLERTSPKESSTSNEEKKSPNLQKEEPKEQTSTKRPKESKKPDTPIKSLPTLKSLNPGYTRFGFKLNYDVNPFSINNKTDINYSQSLSSKKNTAKKDFTRPLKEIKGLKRQATLPSLTGATSARDAAKQTVMREKSFTDKRNKIRNENRTVIKGVRTNRRFELQMRMRNVE